MGNPKIERYGKNVDKFNSDTYSLLEKVPRLGPIVAQITQKMSKVNIVYDEANECYLYTEKWVNFLINKMQDEEEYNSLYL